MKSGLAAWIGAFAVAVVVVVASNVLGSVVAWFGLPPPWARSGPAAVVVEEAPAAAPRMPQLVPTAQLDRERAAAREATPAPSPTAVDEAAEPVTEMVAAVVDEAAETVAVVADGALAAQGEQVARKCAACHTFEPGGANKIGPNLWGVMTRERSSVEGYAYSSAVGDLSGMWTPENLDTYLENPRAYARGTKMTLALKNPVERQAIIAYLATLRD